MHRRGRADSTVAERVRSAHLAGHVRLVAAAAHELRNAGHVAWNAGVARDGVLGVVVGRLKVA